ncbi:nucleoside ABC transporter membrane protein [Oscillibacter sp. PC13]|uniref:ABC transporter permease n=1 Tax=Oscillibacter sp. PC13 TaxID=1855299 RepID=UPI0008EF40A5|nr:ABC transporter permease [Oscillibacter sp. PC13]SFQ10185.1 nucleoside ABC transporter membrane protein [Oscillibacter sp. PC13]
MKGWRESLPKWGVILLAGVLSLAIGSVFILVVGGNPLAAYRQLLLVPMSSKSGFGELLTNMTPLLIAGVGMAIARSAGLTNLGGEGQIYMGALGMFLVCSSDLADTVGKPVLLLGAVVAVAFGAFWGSISGALKAFFRANEIITSLLLNYIAVNFIGYLIRGPLQEPSGMVPESSKIGEGLRLAKLIASTRAHTGIVLAIVLIVLYEFFIYRSRVGYRIRVLGGGEKAAVYSGIPIKWYHLGVMALSGGIAGLAGGVELLGVYYRLTETMAGDIGFTAVVVALLGMLHPVGIVLAAMLMALLNTGAQFMQVISGVPITLVDILQGLIVLFVLLGLSFQLPQLKRKEG